MSVKRTKRDSTFDLVSIHDDAIDEAKSDTKGYKKTLDHGKLVMKAGKKPTYFICKNMPQLRRAELSDEHFKIEMPEDLDSLQKVANNAGKVKPKVKIIGSSQLTIKYFNECVVGVKEWDGSKYNEEKLTAAADEFSGRTVQDIGDQCMSLTEIGESIKNG